MNKTRGNRTQPSRDEMGRFESKNQAASENTGKSHSGSSAEKCGPKSSSRSKESSGKE